jgi:large subunit ribosomal protein L21
MSDPIDPTRDPETDAEAPEAEAAPEPVASADAAESEPGEADAAGAEAEPVEAEATGATEAGAEAEAEAEATEEVMPIASAEPAPERPRRAPRGPRPYAVVETGGKQYRVSVGDTISVEKLNGEEGSDVVIERVLLLGGDGAPRVGTPTVAGASVTARIDEQFRGEKIVIFKYKPKKRYRRKMGHRQSLTRLEITAINA